jgi:hypothetical protein
MRCLQFGLGFAYFLDGEFDNWGKSHGEDWRKNGAKI